MRAVSIGTMIKQLGGLVGTDDLTEWEEDFVSDVCERTEEGKFTTALSEKQVLAVQKIHSKHFAG